MQINQLLEKLGININLEDGDLPVYSPINGSIIANIRCDDIKQTKEKIDETFNTAKIWRDIPAPKRGELIRMLGNELRANKSELSQLVTIECGKILEESQGEVQEMIDICDFAVGLSRCVGGLTLPSERPEHVMHENWLPLGVVGVISAFNFPVAVWAWNFALAIICGNCVIWKPSEKTPLCALACASIFERAAEKSNMPHAKNLLQLAIGKTDIGNEIVVNNKVALVSATGSTNMGRKVAPLVAKRFGKSLLELGGNNAAIITQSANLDIALPSILFGAVGTAGQRCTTTRRVFIHESIYDNVTRQLSDAYNNINSSINDPLKDGTLIGPLIDKDAYIAMQNTLQTAKEEGGTIVGGERILEDEYPDAYYVKPALVKMNQQTSIVMNETFAPILYAISYKDIENAMIEHNVVKQGLSSTIFTNDIRQAEFFKQHSDCGIANVNIGTSGAEIGGAFGGEKETGGGRESGSDAWKNYMRRQTSTTYYGYKAPELAQGINFDIK